MTRLDGILCVVNLLSAIDVFNKLVVADPNFGDTATPLDYGALVEAMLFYGHVDVVGQWSAVEQLVRTCGPDGFRALLAGGHLHFTYQENWALVASVDDASTGERLMAAMAMDMNNTGPTPGTYSVHDELQRAHYAVFGKKGGSRRFATSVAPLVRVDRIDAGTITRAVDDFHDDGYLAFAVRRFLKDRVPGFPIPDPLVFAIEPARGAMLHLSDTQSDTFVVRTNVDFEAATRAFQDATGTKSTLSTYDVLSQVLLSRSKLEQAAALGGELATNALHSTLIAERVQRSVTASASQSQARIAAFTELTLGNSLAIREAVNSGAVSFRDTVALLEQAGRFRDWLRDQPHRADLLSSYVRAATAGTWAERLPAKTVRWLAFEAAGAWLDSRGVAVGPIAAHALSLGDAFIVDRLLKGWNPSQFVSGPLKRYASKRT